KTGKVSLAGAGSTFFANGEWYIFGGEFNLLGGTLIATHFDSWGGTFNFTGGTQRVDSFIGDLVNQGGTLAVGSSHTTTVVVGDYEQQLAGVLEIEIGGTKSTEIDRLFVDGELRLDGVLTVILKNGFMPSPDHSFNI